MMGEEETEYFDEEEALAVLLQDDVLFAITVGETTGVRVQCGDIFAWGCADSEVLPITEIEALYKMHLADKKWGSSKWCCIRRNEQPQAPVARDMMAEGSWDDVMGALNENEYDRRWREHRAAESTAGSST